MILTYSIGIAFIVASMAVTYGLDKKSLFDPYIEMLTPEEKNRYDAIVQERRRIYLTGFSLGLIVALLVILFVKNLTPMMSMGIGVALVGAISYFYYILTPKSDYMIQYLDEKEERKAWWKIYRTLQFYYHFAFMLGLAGSMLLFYGIKT